MQVSPTECRWHSTDMNRLYTALILTTIAIRPSVYAAGEITRQETGLVLSAVQRNPNAVLHKPEYKDKEIKVVGIVNGMVHKLTKLSERLSNQLAQVKQQSNTTVVFETATEDAQRLIAAIIQSLQTIPESDKPATLIPEIREQILMLRTKLLAVQNARIQVLQAL